MIAELINRAAAWIERAEALGYRLFAYRMPDGRIFSGSAEPDLPLADHAELSLWSEFRRIGSASVAAELERQGRLVHVGERF